MRSVEEIAEALQSERLEEVAAETGLGYFTVLRFRNRRTVRPSFDAVSRLSEWLDKRESARAS